MSTFFCFLLNRSKQMIVRGPIHKTYNNSNNLFILLYWLYKFNIGFCSNIFVWNWLHSLWRHSLLFDKTFFNFWFCLFLNLLHFNLVHIFLRSLFRDLCNSFLYCIINRKLLYFFGDVYFLLFILFNLFCKRWSSFFLH